MHPSKLIGTRTAAVVACTLAGYAMIRARRTDESFRDAVVLITGGSRGLGLALARVFAAEGARLVLLARDGAALRRAAEQLSGDYGVAVTTVPCDVRERASVEDAVAAAVVQAGRLDVLVNNAGIIQVMPFENAQDEDFRDSLNTHFWGSYNMVRACVPHLARQRGRIVNIASIGGRIAVPHLAPYVVGKFALVGFSESLRAELGAAGISVTTVTPHLMQTGSHRNALVRGQHEREATWFALGTASRLVSVPADRAARLIVRAARDRRATVTPGWLARAATIVNAVTPPVVAAASAVAMRVLPAPAPPPEGNEGRLSRDIDIGVVSRLFATEAARELNQPVAADETRASSAKLEEQEA